MADVLEPSGLMVHVCPNYAFPYDPHFGIPLVPFRPDLTAMVLPRRIARSGAWHSLNFISAARLKRLTAQYGLEARFETGQLADMIRRVQDDPVFAERHGGFAAALLKATRTLGVEQAARMLPVWIDSPMLVELRFRQAA